MIEASAILPRLWQGSAPPLGSHVALAGFHTLVLCAAEFQPEMHHFPGVEVIYAPNDDRSDTPPTKEQLLGALRAARVVTERVKASKRVLVTCMQGRNRSGLVSALSLYLLGVKPSEAVNIIKNKRQRHALSNPRFVEALLRLPAHHPLMGRLQ